MSTEISAWRRGARLSLGTAAAVFVAVLGFALCRRGIVLSDEGYLLSQSYDFLHGKVLYRDLDSFISPGVWFLLAGLFSVVEPSVLATRGAALLGYFGNAFFIYRIVAGISGRRYAAVALMAYGVASVWAFPAWTFSYYSPYSILFALAALERLLAWGERRRRRDLVAVGVAVGLSIIFKQNFGSFAAVAVAVGTFSVCWAEHSRILTALARTIRAGLWIIAGTFIATLPFVAYFAHQGALGDAYHALFVAPFTEFATRHAIAYMPLRELWDSTLLVGTNRMTYGAYALSNDFGFVTLASPTLRSVVALLHVGAYWFPPVLLVAGVVLAITRGTEGEIDPKLACVTAMAGLLFLGVFPRADFTHLMHVYQPLLPLAAIVVQRSSVRLRVKSVRFARALPLAGVAVLGIYGIVAVGWMRDLVSTHTARIVNRRGGVMLSPLSADMLNFEVSEMQKVAAPGEPILTLPALSMLNFLADRPMPGKYYNLYGVHIAHDQGRGAVDEAEAKHVNHIVAHYYNFFSDAGDMKSFAPNLTEYVRRYFRIDESISTDTHMIMSRRPVPLPEVPAVDFRASCDVGRFDIADRVVVPYLLFDSLYHMHGRGNVRGMNRRDTFCRVHADHDNRLYFMLDIRRPQQVRLPSSFRVDVWLLRAVDVDTGRVTVPDDLDNGRIQPRFSVEIPATPADGWASPAPSEHVLSLADFKDEDVVVALRSTFTGDVDINPLDYRGVGVVWHDLRLGHADLDVAVADATVR